jgi:hypothetical protein
MDKLDFTPDRALIAPLAWHLEGLVYRIEQFSQSGRPAPLEVDVLCMRDQKGASKGARRKGIINSWSPTFRATSEAI